MARSRTATSDDDPDLLVEAASRAQYLFGTALLLLVVLLWVAVSPELFTQPPEKARTVHSGSL